MTVEKTNLFKHNLIPTMNLIYQKEKVIKENQ